MKRPRKLTRAMKICLKEQGLNPLNWWYVKSTAEGVVLLHKSTGSVMEIKNE